MFKEQLDGLAKEIDDFINETWQFGLPDDFEAEFKRRASRFMTQLNASPPEVQQLYVHRIASYREFAVQNYILNVDFTINTQAAPKPNRHTSQSDNVVVPEIATIDFKEKARRLLDKKENYRRREVDKGQVYAKGMRGLALMRIRDKYGAPIDYEIERGKDDAGRDIKLGEGNYGRVKFARNIYDGSRDVVKIQIICDRNRLEWIQHEDKMLAEVGQGKGSIIRNKQLKGPRLTHFIQLLHGENLDNQADALKKEASENERAGRGYYATVQQAVSVIAYAPGKTLTKIISPSALSVTQSNYLNIATEVIRAYQSQIQGVDANGQLLPGRTMSLVHRDIKPDNIRFDESSGKATFVDFGMAHDASVVPADFGGTEGYMAPELYQRFPTTEKSDVYALGVVLKEILGFQNHYGSINFDNPEATARVPDINQRRQLAVLVRQMTSLLPEDRPNIRECLNRLNEINPNLDHISILQHAQELPKEVSDKRENIIDVALNEYNQTDSSSVDAMLKEMGALSQAEVFFKEQFEQLEQALSSNQSSKNAEVEEQVTKLEKLQKEMLAHNKEVKEINDTLAVIKQINLSVKDPKQIIKFSENVNELIKNINDAKFINDETKKILLTNLKDTFNNKSGKLSNNKGLEQTITEKLNKRSLGAQIKDVIEEKVLHKQSTREKLESARAKFSEADYRIKNLEINASKKVAR